MTGRIWGYCRVSTEDQDLSVQLADLRESGALDPFIFAEKKSGTTREGRDELNRLLNVVRDGDVIHVTRIDRLARSMVDFANIVNDLKARGVGLRVLKQGIDTTIGGPVGELTMNMLAAFASFETALRRERQMEGIKKAKAEGKYAGRPKSIDRARVRQMLAAGDGPTKIAAELGIHRSHVYRIRDEPEAPI